MLKLVAEEFPALSLRTVEEPPLVKNWRKRYVWSAEGDCLDPWVPWRESIPCGLCFAAAKFGWRMPTCAAVPNAAKCFINTLRVVNQSPAIEPGWSDLLGATFYFDVSSYRNKAFYQLSASLLSRPIQIEKIEYELKFGATLFCEDVDFRVIANVRRIEWALCATAKMCGMPILT